MEMNFFIESLRPLSNKSESELKYPKQPSIFNPNNISHLVENTVNNNNNNTISRPTSHNKFGKHIGNEMKSVLLCKWLVIVTSCLFISLISWDIVGDKEGWYGGIWIPSSGLGMLMLLWLINYLTINLTLMKWIKLKYLGILFLFLRNKIILQ